jgi:hypothetical protein
MNTASFSRTIVRNLLGAGLICMAFALVTNAQEQTQTQVQAGQPTRQISVRRGTVVYVSGNNVVMKGEDGRIRAFNNVPDSARIIVDGQPLSVHDVRPGMKIERITITKTTPEVITTIKTVTGTVFSVTPPISVVLTLEDGKNQEFKIPDGTKFTIDGQPTDAFSLKPGMKVSATAVTEVPETVVTKRSRMLGQMPAPPPETISPDAPLIIIVPVPVEATEAAPAPAETPAPAPAEPAPAKLPKTGSSLPLVGLLGGVFCSLAFGLKARRAFSSCPVSRNRSV